MVNETKMIVLYYVCKLYCESDQVWCINGTDVSDCQYEMFLQQLLQQLTGMNVRSQRDVKAGVAEKDNQLTVSKKMSSHLVCDVVVGKLQDVPR